MRIRLVFNLFFFFKIQKSLNLYNNKIFLKIPKWSMMFFAFLKQFFENTDNIILVFSENYSYYLNLMFFIFSVC